MQILETYMKLSIYNQMLSNIKYYQILSNIFNQQVEMKSPKKRESLMFRLLIDQVILNLIGVFYLFALF